MPAAKAAGRPLLSCLLSVYWVAARRRSARALYLIAAFWQAPHGARPRRPYICGGGQSMLPRSRFSNGFAFPNNQFTPEGDRDMADNTVRGRFVWHELMTPDPSGAHAFYSKVVGWKTQPWEHDPSYQMFAAASGPLGGTVAQAAGTPHWLHYVGTPTSKRRSRRPRAAAAASRRRSPPCRRRRQVRGAGRSAGRGLRRVLLADGRGQGIAGEARRVLLARAGDHRLESGRRLLLGRVRLGEDGRARHGRDGQVRALRQQRRAARRHVQQAGRVCPAARPGSVTSASRT